MLADRIKLARKKNGMSLRALAEAMGSLVTAQAIGKYERSESVPSSGVLLALSKALKVSLTYLLDTQEVSLASVEFRTKANTTARDRASVETEVLEWIERYLQIEVILDLDSAHWMCPLAKPRRLKSIDDAEKLADDIRVKWQLGIDPIPNMTELLEEKGLKVLTVKLPERVSGFTCLVQRPQGQAPLPVIVVNSRFSLERRRLTLAHELAHRLIDTDCLDDKDEEKAANLFAAAFLMPAENLLREVDLQRILDTAAVRQPVARYAHLATPAEIAENDFNLNIPRYVDTFVEEAEIDLMAVRREREQLKAELARLETQMDAYLKELGYE